MAYRINKTDGSILTDLNDGVVDTTTTDITLIGKNYSGFGEALNENLVKMLENFSSTSAPENALKGQLWYDAAQNRLKVYDGETFVSANGTIVGTVATNVDTGDIFIDTGTDQLKFYNGTSYVVVGPTYTKTQGKTGTEGIDIVDTVGVQRTVLGQYIAGVLKGIWSSVEFTPNTATTPTGWTAGTVIKIGFNPVDTVNYNYRGTSNGTDSLTDSLGNSFTPSSFVKVEERNSLNALVDQRIESGLFVKGTSGLSVGYQDAKYATLRVDSSGTEISVIDIERQNSDFAIRTTEGSSKINAIKIDSSERRIGIFTDTPSTALDVTGDVTVSGTVYANQIDTTDSTEVVINPFVRMYSSAAVAGTLSVTNIDSEDSSEITIDPPVKLLSDLTVENGSVAGSIRITNTSTPGSATDPGQTGEIRWDSNYIYVCIATDTWKRVAISTW